MQNAVSKGARDFSVPGKVCLGSSVARFFAGSKSLVLMLLVLVSATVVQAQTDFSALTDGVEADISGMKTTIMGICAAVIGVAIIFLIYRLVKRAISG
jgi:hypothetical protein